ncbi:MAG: DUF2075 domain-containing protein [Phycisphaerales bacterium]|nr:DUF2075 domain-containing protein [Phycisphaerales bacterium]
MTADPDAVVGRITQAASADITPEQARAWVQQVPILSNALGPYVGRGRVFFEYAVPRLGKRIDGVLLIDGVVLVVEFKVGESEFTAQALDQVWDYALDLKNFHETSHNRLVVPVLVPTEAGPVPVALGATGHGDGLLRPVRCAPESLPEVIEAALAYARNAAIVQAGVGWESGRYSPTPTIIEAARALYANHSVADISRSDAGATNLSRTSAAVTAIIADARANNRKAICFVTGVPGAGKTLVGLDVATRHAAARAHGQHHSVFLSGNGPLVAILREALARDNAGWTGGKAKKKKGRKASKGAVKTKTLGQARTEVKAFIQNVHHFRDEYARHDDRAPVDHVAVFDEAQRAWNRAQASKFMRTKRSRHDFDQSEPEFLVRVMDRHPDWAVVVCLVGGGQEINTGEAGIGEWVSAVASGFPHWHVHISPRLEDAEFQAGAAIRMLEGRQCVHADPSLHLAVSMRSFRAEKVSALVKAVLDRDRAAAAASLNSVLARYPIRLTRSLPKAKEWLRAQARGTERFGIVASSTAERLRPHAINVKAPMDPVLWFLNDKDDVRSSYYLEDAASEFAVQGLELDFAAVVWDGDLQYQPQGWRHRFFSGNSWKNIKKTQDQTFLLNAYRVLLTRARQGMVVVVPEGDPADPTRDPAFYDPTFEYLRAVGLPLLA